MRKLILILTFISVSCSAGKEQVMPFRNFGYSGERLFPIQSSDAENIVRIWINNSTSIDRVITIFKDSILNEQAELIEIGLTKNGKRKFLTQENKIPASGIANFFKKLDSLNLFKYKSQENFSLVLHEPFSLYVIEQKKGEKYNQFTFRTNFPNENEEETEFTVLEKFIMDEFQWEFKLK
ncbi:hypothetical protein G3567_12920 [Psychroflexus sp. YR1-1]|uniref:Lipoprotein n=1 Tax=Psychroflexus aurantiacus TaxID=2709310 RepID=A0A6B3R2Z4_9FLAO|nr:hypothetical protein [Psychroflexus aurantiacus]NEV95039.1 hypothetical protein [Psychroflexus aurantiacus]